MIRNQISSLKQNEISALPAEVTTTPIPVVETATPKKSSVWDFLNETDDTSQNNEDDDLLALLANRNTNLGSAKKSAAVEQKSLKPSTAVAATAGKQPCLITKKAFPVCQLKEEEEYCDIAIDGEDGEVYGDEVDQSHIESLLSSYLKDEDDTENLLALQTHGIGAGATVRPVTHSQDDDQEEDEEEEIEVKSGKGQKKVDDDFAEDKLTMESKKHKIEFYFQRRASLYPNQILRYAYDGIPLWITSPSPLEEEEARIKKSNNKASNALIPDCECCGASRVFECQLMPALLSLMSKHMPKSSNDAKAKTANGDQRSRPDVNEILGDTMDFGVVTVWSCRNSCEPINNQYQREVVIVQPPSDLI